jgi:hypothetical protein
MADGIDPHTGELVLGELRVGVRTQRRDLAGTWSDMRTGWTNVRIEHAGWIVHVHFEGDRLAFYNLYDPAPDDEQQRQAAHDAWLARTLGSPPYRFAWGELSSSYDPRSDDSSITVRFR